LVAQSDLLHRLNPDECDVCAIQELYLDHLHNSHATPLWFTVYPNEHYTAPDKTGSLILVNECMSTDVWAQVHCRSSDITAIQVSTGIGQILIVNTYSDNTHQEGMQQAYQTMRRQAHEGQ